jgi:hypothetical protein
VNNEEYNKEEEPRDARLTTAALAAAGEKGVDFRARETEARQKEMRAGSESTVNGAVVASAGAGAALATDEQAGPLFLPDEATKFRARWDAIQGAFVDEPRRAVEQADSLVAEAVKRLAEMFADERSKLEGHWDRGDTVSTEDLRLALRRYRAFFGRVLSV